MLEIVNKQWDKFVYNGNNMEATTWVMTDILRHMLPMFNQTYRTVFIKIGDDGTNKKQNKYK